MSISDQIQAAAEHLALALELLDQVGADVTAAQIDSAIECLKGEVRSIDWNTSLEEVEQIEALVKSWDRNGEGPGEHPFQIGTN